jgi:hypothetical protein
MSPAQEIVRGFFFAKIHQATNLQKVAFKATQPS